MLSSNFSNSCRFAHSSFDDNIAYASIDDLKIEGLIVSDTNTSSFFSNNSQKIILPADVLPTIEQVNYIRSHQYKRLIAVGGGTINDICKYASFLDGKPFITIPTAPSVNGYASSTASIIVNNLKKSYSAHLPEKIYLCLEILINAPMRLIISGFSEIICHYTTQPDWLLSNLLLGTTYSDIPFKMLDEMRDYVISHRDGLPRRNPEIIKILMEALILSGLGMNFMGSSHPASQGEHQIVHTMELHKPTNEYFHGEKVAVATISMVKLQNFIMHHKLQAIPCHMQERIEEYYGDMAAQHIKIWQDKKPAISPEAWDVVKKKLCWLVADVQEMENLLHDVGAPTSYQDVAWSRAEYDAACWMAGAVRDRFTFLDLLPYVAEAGKFSFS